MLAWSTQPNRSGSGGVPRVFRIPGPTPATGTNPRTGGRQPENLAFHSGHQPQNWTPLDCISMPSDKTSRTSLWNPHSRKTLKGERRVEFLTTCGAAQEKQSTVAPPASTPPALPGFLVWGFLAAGHNGRHPKNWFQVTPLYSELYRQRGPT